MLDLAVAYEALKKLGAGFALVSKAKGFLLPDRDTAGEELAVALDQIVKTFAAVDRAIADYVSLAIAPGVIDQSPQGLAHAAGGALEVQVRNERGHCHAIKGIYDKHLERWFQKRLGKTDFLLLENLFNEWADADGGLFDRLMYVATLLRKEAQEVIALAVAGNRAEAAARLRASYPSLTNLSNDLRASMIELIKLRDEFRGWG